MAIISKSVLINASIEQLQLFLNDIKQFPGWYEGLEGLNPEPGFPTQVGSTSTYTYKVAGLTMTGILIVTKNVPFVERHINVEGMIMGIQQWKFASDGVTTRVYLQGQYEISRELLEKQSDRLFVERLSDKYAEESLGMMKTRIEELKSKLNF